MRRRSAVADRARRALSEVPHGRWREENEGEEDAGEGRGADDAQGEGPQQGREDVAERQAEAGRVGSGDAPREAERRQLHPRRPHAREERRDHAVQEPEARRKGRSPREGLSGPAAFNIRGGAATVVAARASRSVQKAGLALTALAPGRLEN